MILALLLLLVPAPTMPTQPCEFEDSAGPCFWDAGMRGNHRGHSFWVDEHQRVHYLDPSVDPS